MKNYDFKRRSKNKTSKSIKKLRAKRVSKKLKKQKVVTFTVYVRRNRLAVRKPTNETVTHWDKQAALSIAAAKFPNRWVSLVV